jgi:hypothetical protein
VIQALQSDHDPLRIAEAARLRYGSVAVAKRFLRAIRELKVQKEQRAKVLQAIDWKGLYQDAGDFL